MFLLATLAAVLAIEQVVAVPSASSLGSDLTFLFQNDLHWPTAPEHNGTILINKAGTNAQGVAACAQLSETLLQTNGIFFKSDIKALLGYVAFSGAFSARQQFWIASQSAKSCSAISIDGGIQSIRCNTNLPALCSQSAPYRPNTNTDPNPNFHVQVTSKKLTLLGTRDALSFRFIGIPYADPFLRFTYSQPFSTQASLSALAYGSRCTQAGGGTEDCLFLNVYTPFLPQDGAKSRSLRPVMFWIHGGAFTGGEGSDGIFDGGNQASRSDVVVVTINYRLSTIGFLGLNDGVTNGNFGIGDMITALQWVQEHIADFGGDPNRVTIFGQSAGAGAVRTLLAAKPAFGLFQGAIAQSNLGGFGFATQFSEWITLEDEFTNFGEKVVQEVGCGNETTSASILSCLRAVPAQTLISVANAPSFVIIDGRIVTTPHLELDGSGPTAKAHVIFGWMRDDGADFIGNFPGPTTTEEQILLGAGLAFNATVAAVGSSLFPMPNGANQTLNVFNVSARVATDGQFRCIDQATVTAAAKHRIFESIFAYQFDRSYGGFEPIPGICDPEATPSNPFGNPELPYFRCHSGELIYMFGNFGQSSAAFRDSNDLVFGQVATDVWASFARTFNPNPDPAYLFVRGYTNTTQALLQGGLWEPLTPGTTGSANGKPLRILDVPLSNSALVDEEQCSLIGFPFTLFE